MEKSNLLWGRRISRRKLSIQPVISLSMWISSPIRHYDTDRLSEDNVKSCQRMISSRWYFWEGSQNYLKNPVYDVRRVPASIFYAQSLSRMLHPCNSPTYQTGQRTEVWGDSEVTQEPAQKTVSLQLQLQLQQLQQLRQLNSYNIWRANQPDEEELTTATVHASIWSYTVFKRFFDWLIIYLRWPSEKSISG